MPDMSIDIDEITVEGDTAVARWTLHGTHTGSYMGIPPSDKAVTMVGVTIFHFKDDKVYECWDVEDTYHFLRQIGAAR